MVSNRSPSPTSKQNPNPNLRGNYQEREGFGVKKSFNGHPFVKSSLIHQQKGFTSSTPVNSPAEYARSSSFGRDSGGVSFRDHEQKENERDLLLKPVARAKSPSVITKGAKNFMSPTISAASKITPSPRKRVLGERNEAIRTSASLSDGKFHFFSTNSVDFDSEIETKLGMNLDKPETEVHFSEPDKDEFIYQNGFTSHQQEVKIEAFEADLVVLSPEVPINTTKIFEPLPLSEMPKMDSDFKTDAYSSQCTKDPLDADPSIPPYDPKNNYLSPRPQFLHYNPNWRSESLASQGMNLEDDFTSESVSEVENNSEEVQSEDSLNDQVVSDSSSSIEVSQLPDTNPIESQQSVEVVEPALEKFEPRKSQLFTKWKFVAVLLLFSLGFMSVSTKLYPGIGDAMYRDEIISQVYKNPHIVYLVENFNVLVQHTTFWSAHYVDYLSQMLHNVREVVKVSPLTYVNLTSWKEGEDWGYMGKESDLKPYFVSIEDEYRDLVNDRSITQMYSEPEGGYDLDKVKQNYEIEDGGIDEVEVDTFDKGADIVKPDDSLPEEEVKQNGGNGEVEVDSLDKGADIVKPDDSLPEEDVKQNLEIEDEATLQMQSYCAPEDNKSTTGEAEILKPNNSEKDVVMAEQNLEIEDGVLSLTGEDEIMMATDSDIDAVVEEQELSVDKHENTVDGFNVRGSHNDVNAENIQPKSEKVEISPGIELQPDEEDVIKSISKSIVSEATNEISQLVEEIKKSSAAIINTVILAVLMCLFAAFMYKKLKKSDPLTKQLVSQKEDHKYAATASNMEHSFCGTQSDQVEVEIVGDSCPSEMSSFQISDHTKSKQKSDNEAHSLQKSSKRNYKRESLAAASSEYTMNSSYGSFSTYSVIHPKHGDNEVVTPVRRSSRIRSKVTSP